MFRDLHRLRTRCPFGAGSRGLDQIRGAFIIQIAQAVFDRVDARGKGQLIDIRLMGESIGQRRNAPHPRSPDNGRHVVYAHAHVFKIIGRDRSAVAHFEHRRYRFDPPCQQQCQGRRTVGRVAGLEIVTGHTTIGIDAAIDFHQLCRAFGLPDMLLLAGQLHPYRQADGPGQQHRIGTHVVGAVAPVTTGRFHADDLDPLFRVLQQPCQVSAQ